MAIGESIEERRVRLDRNEELIIKWVEDHGVEVVKKGDYHYLVAGVFDYWARTGLFINRVTKKRGRGKRALLNQVRKSK